MTQCPKCETTCYRHDDTARYTGDTLTKVRCPTCGWRTTEYAPKGAAECREAPHGAGWSEFSFNGVASPNDMSGIIPHIPNSVVGDSVVITSRNALGPIHDKYRAAVQAEHVRWLEEAMTRSVLGQGLTEHSSLELTVDGRKMEEAKDGGSLGMPQYRVTSRNAAGVAERCEHAAPPVATYTEPPSEDIRHGDSLFYDGALWIWDDSRGHRGQWWREDAKHYSPSDHPPSPWEVADELEAAKKAEPPRSSLSDMIKAALPKDKPRCDSCTYGPRDRECIECLYPDSNYKAKHGGVLAKGQSDPSMNGMYYPPVFPERKCSNCADFRGVGFGCTGYISNSSEEGLCSEWRKRTVAEHVSCTITLPAAPVERDFTIKEQSAGCGRDAKPIVITSIAEAEELLGSGSVLDAYKDFVCTRDPVCGRSGIRGYARDPQCEIHGIAATQPPVVAEPPETDAELRARALAKMARDWGAFCNVPLVDNIETATGAALDKICVANGVRRGSK